MFRTKNVLRMAAKTPLMVLASPENPTWSRVARYKRGVTKKSGPDPKIVVVGAKRGIKDIV